MLEGWNLDGDHSEKAGNIPRQGTDLPRHVVGIEVKCADVLADAVDGLVALQGGCAHVEDLLQGGSFLPWHRLLLILQTPLCR
jgi:hypothetical protein